MLAPLVLGLAVGALTTPGRAAAASGGAGVSGSGDEIISSILASVDGAPGRSGNGSPETSPRCRWHTLTDEQVVFLVVVAAQRPELLEAAFLTEIQQYTNLEVITETAEPSGPRTPGGHGTGPPTEPNDTGARADPPGRHDAGNAGDADRGGPDPGSPDGDVPDPGDPDSSVPVERSPGRLPSAGTSTVDASPVETFPAEPAPVEPGPVESGPTAASPAAPSGAGPGAAGGETVTAVTHWKLAVRVCDGVARTMEVRSRTVTDQVAMVASVTRGLARRSTLLPPPNVKLSPAPRLGATPRTVVGEPVFVSTTPPGAVTSRLSFGGRTVEVRAEPHGIEVFDGEPALRPAARDCGGFGRPFDSSDPAPPARQATAPGACALWYERATGGVRRDAWLGYVRMHWHGEFRIDGGAPRPLDGLFSLSLFDMAVDEVDTAIGARGP